MSLILSPTQEALYPPTKFQPPPLRPEHVQRDRCLRLVRTPPLAAAHLLISAPAGAGKSTLAAQWAAEHERCAWVSLSEADDEPGQFWAAFILGIREACPGFGGELLSELLGGAELRGLFPHLVDELAELEELGVVLDDLHLIANRECHYELGWLLERAPPNARLALCSREDPPVPVGRLVAQGQLAVLRVTDLQFDASETAEFLHDRLGLDLDPAQIRAISQRTDGWAAGVYLAALSLRAGVAAEEVIASTGSCGAMSGGKCST
jgi:LuxR family maltose regulon positive regulatory protein